MDKLQQEAKLLIKQLFYGQFQMLKRIFRKGEAANLRDP